MFMVCVGLVFGSKNVQFVSFADSDKDFYYYYSVL